MTIGPKLWAIFSTHIIPIAGILIVYWGRQEEKSGTGDIAVNKMTIFADEPLLFFNGINEYGKNN